MRRRMPMWRRRGGEESRKGGRKESNRHRHLPGNSSRALRNPRAAWLGLR